MGRKLRAVSVLMVLMMALLVATGCGGSKSSSSGGTLTFTIWDVGQQPGMQAIVDAYEKDHPDTHIEVQVTNWNEYWTKLEAGITSHTAPDIFWMHSTYIYEYADAGVLASCEDIVNRDDFPESALLCCMSSDGELFSVPKDKDTVGLIYNKKLFDEAGVEYPNADWTWDDLSSSSEKIYEKTGKYGFMAYNDEQLGYWPFVYQAGGYIVNDDRTRGGFDVPETQMAIKYYVDLQKNSWCPDQNFFAQNSPESTFYSGNGAMYLAGSWNMLPNLENFPEMKDEWDVAELPKCPTPPAGDDGRATVSNSLGYATTADNPRLDEIKDFLAFCGTEEAQRIQGVTGTAIPAYNGLESTWVDYFKEQGYTQNMDNFIKMFDYAVPLPNDISRPSWRIGVGAKLLQIYNGNIEYDVGLNDMQELVDQAMAGY